MGRPTSPLSYEASFATARNWAGRLVFPPPTSRWLDLTPAPGIYAAYVKLEDGAREGLAYFGSRPTVDGKGDLLEVHLLEFADDIYG